MKGNQSMETPIKYGLIGLISLIVLFVLSPFTAIPAGSRGVVTHFGKVQDEVLGEGLHFTLPIATTVHKISTRVQKSEDETDAATKDMQKVRAKLAINWHVNPITVNRTYQTVGDEDAIERGIIAPAVSEVLKAATAKMTAEEVLTKRIELKTNIDAALIKRLAGYGVLVDDISLTNLDFTAEFNRAVEQKQIAEQEAQRAVYITQKARKEADATIETARGQAEAQKLVKQTLTPEVLQQRAIEKWDGSFPQVMGSGTLPFVNLNLKQRANNEQE
jgi:prohibitin 1